MENASLLGHSASWWDAAMLMSLGVAAFVAFIVAGATAGSVVANKRENAAAKEELDRYKSEAGERTAALENAAAQARLETEKLRAQLAWRTVSPHTVKALEAELSLHPGAVNVEYVSGDPEANNLAIQIANIFGAAKWQVGMLGVTFNSTAVFGLWVPDPPSKDTPAIRTAFSKYQLGFASNALPTGGMSFGGTVDGGAVVFVGSKKPN
jgi:hypothetical protein